MIEKMNWVGEINGHLVVTDDSGAETTLDRPGDLVAHMMQAECPSELQASILVHGYCLATQGVRLPHLVRQVLKKTGVFIRSVDMNSMPLYQATEHFQSFFADCKEEGVELQEAVLAEVSRYCREKVS
ncbi:MAG: hypothetical protein CBC13_10645 [Planctomycetia bacterium TMED53]|nr:MAG: hypothetical protein CBC13_10645 [Planctomycetia bacterium TMED53]